MNFLINRLDNLFIDINYQYDILTHKNIFQKVN